MYNIRQFKPTLYFLVFLGICGFALAAEAPMLFLIGVIALSINAWLVHRGGFRPIPRIISNVVTIATLIYFVHEAFTSGVTPVLMIGEFLLLLQMVKLWEQRGNRDYATILVLSLLLMVAAAISTVSIVFGFFLAVYLFLSLYCCLLFHLKVETDAAQKAMNLPARKITPAVLRQDERRLTQSMRKLTAWVSGVSLIFAVVVFVFFPRGTGAGMLGPVQFKPTQALVGFTDEVTFQNIARIQQNETPIAYVKLTHNGVPVQGGMPLLLRGVTLDSYTGKQGGWRWVRWPRARAKNPREEFLLDEWSPDFRAPEISADDVRVLAASPRPADLWTQHITLLPTGTNVLFAMAGPYSIKPVKPLNLHFSPRDGEMRNVNPRKRDRPPTEIVYDVTCSNDLGNTPPPLGSGTRRDQIDPLIPRYIAEHNVAGSNSNGSLADQRQKHVHSNDAPDDLDEEIARNIETYLKSKPFSYSLDLTDTKTIEGRDPLTAFLYDIHKGHCEYFAGAMTLMCQSLGMNARMCLGFRCAEYNGTPGADYYIVRQSHAHAWVEVLTKKGWKTFDPTSELDSVEQARHAGLMQKIRHLFDFLQFAYGNAIITYSNEDRLSLIQNAEAAMIRATSGSARLQRMRQVDQLMASKKYWTFSSAAIMTVMMLMAAGALALIAWFAWDKWRLHRRAARIGIASLPAGEQLRLARQLEFYDTLLTLLGRHHISRRPHQTPLEFSRSLLFLPAEAYEAVQRLTRVFYRVRYGNAKLTPARQRHLGTVIEKLEKTVRTANAPHT